MLTSEKVRNLYKEYVIASEWSWLGSQDIVTKRSQLLFNISGGVRFEEALAGLHTEEFKLVGSEQMCLRTDGWEKIGFSSRHHFTFCMLGHFMFDYRDEHATKLIMLDFAWNFLTKWLHLAPGRLAVTIHPNDFLTKKIWMTLSDIPIIELEANFSVDPQGKRSGYRTEILWRLENSAPKDNLGSYIELWNVVFHQFSKEDEKLLSKISADSGTSVDRLVTASENLLSDFENSDWMGATSVLSFLEDSNMRNRIADLSKTIVSLLSEGLVPGNKAAQYVLRKMIRELYLLFQRIGIEQLKEYIRYSAEYWMSKRVDLKPLEDEVVSFEHCITQGKKHCKKLLKKNNGVLTKKDLQVLLDTHGFPESLAQKYMEEFNADT